MKNVTVSVEGDLLVLQVDLTEEQGVSSSGKSTIVASTEGNQTVPEHPDIKFGLNVYKTR